MSGTYAVIVVEASQQSLTAKPVIGISPIDFAYTVLMMEAATEVLGLGLGLGLAFLMIEAAMEMCRCVHREVCAHMCIAGGVPAYA